MFQIWMKIYILLFFSINYSINGSYQYAGCYTQVFYESFFTSSFMEPTLCFRLCDTPIIYLQKTICRCSGGGLMHHNKQQDKSCSISCPKLSNRQGTTTNTCGGERTYSAYIEANFYTLHGHLFSYQINFFACELWKTDDAYDKFGVNISHIVAKPSLNKIEQCAAACLDNSSAIKSIAFNGDNNKCLCIMPWKPNTEFQRDHYLQILSNNSCDLYCQNTLENSNVDNKFQCGSLNNTHIWAIYDLIGVCPLGFIYIKEFKQCLYTYKSLWPACTPPAKSFVYNGSVTWNDLLKMINTLKLNESLVTIDFDEDFIVNSSWKCSTKSSTTSTSSYYSSYSSYYSWDYNTRYILDNGCLVHSSRTSYAHRYSNRLCITNPLNKYSLPSEDDNDINSTYIPPISSQLKFCPNKWLDLNGRCYRISTEEKTINDARNSCITISEVTLNKSPKFNLSTIDDSEDHVILIYSDEYDDDGQLNDSPKGEIVQYTSEWQARLGFFLLDTMSNTDLPNPISSTSSSITEYEDLDLNESINTTIHHSSINEFQMIDPSENKSSNIKDDSCVLSTRTLISNEEKPTLESISIKNCSKPKYTLCETSTLIVRDYQQGCFQKPLILDLPALISNRLTHELCLTVCQELQTELVILHMNKCYCLNDFSRKVFNLTSNLEKYQKNDCGHSCLGNKHERCGDKNTIVVFRILDSLRTPTDASTPAQPFPDFVYNSCIFISYFNSSTTYQFNMDNMHPRYCLDLCVKHNQTYAYINSNKCFCTNIQLKDDISTEIFSNQECSLKCSGNYFYTCGNQDNSTIYSMYKMQPQCHHGFDVAENNQQCVYAHLSLKKTSFANAKSYCQSIDSQIAKINDILDIENILSKSILNIRTSILIPYYHYKSLNITRYFWIDRTSDILDDNDNTIPFKFLRKCSNVSEIIDKNCLVIRYEHIPLFSFYNTTYYRLCVSESNQCSIESAMPFCIDQHLEPKPKIISPKIDFISTNISIDYSCGNDSNYHFIDNYCYTIKDHEKNWNQAKSECEKDNAMLFVPEKSITLHIIKSLFLHQNSYTSSGFAHVGVMYDNENRTVIQYNTSNGHSQKTIPDSNAVYDLCEKTFLDRYTVLMSKTGLSIQERNQLKKQQIGCGYIDLLTYSVPVIRCDEIPCSRIAAVICQKSPIIKTDVIIAERKIIDLPNVSTTTESSDVNFQESTKSIGRDFAPIFFILATLFALILLGFISTLYNHRLYKRNNNIFSITRRNHNNNTNNSVYCQLSSADEFDLN